MSQHLPTSGSQAPRPDDEALLRGLLTSAPPAPPRHRPVTLRSTGELRRATLAGLRFRTWFDHALVHIERLLLLALVLTTAGWLYTAYGQELLSGRGAMPPSVRLAAIAPGASAAELTAQLGEALPFVPPVSAGAPRAADYLVPAHGFQLPPPPPPTPLPADPRPSRLLIPAAQLDTPVQEVGLVDGTWQVAEYAAGYHQGTALPGAGNTVLAGHAGLHGAVFARLHELRPGDDVYLDAAGHRLHYRVSSSQSVWPRQVEVMYPTSEPILTMITCTAWDTQRLVVVAALVDVAPLLPSAGAPSGQGKEAP